MERSFFEALDEIARGLSAQTGMKILVGYASPNLARIKTDLGPIQEPARNVLVKLLDLHRSRTHKLTWFAYYNARENAYALSILAIKVNDVPTMTAEECRVRKMCQ